MASIRGSVLTTQTHMDIIGN